MKVQRVLRYVLLMSFLGGGTCFAQCINWPNDSAPNSVSCNGLKPVQVFAGLGEGYAFRFSVPSGFTTTVCNLSTYGQVDWGTSDPAYREKFAIVQSAFLAGKTMWFEIKRKSPTDATCVLGYVTAL